MEVTDGLKKALAGIYGTEVDSDYFKEITACMDDFKDPFIHFMGVGISKYSLLISIQNEINRRAFADKILKFSNDAISRINHPAMQSNTRFYDFYRVLQDAVQGGDIEVAKDKLIPLLSAMRIIEAIGGELPAVMNFMKTVQFLIVDLLDEDELRLFNRRKNTLLGPNIFAAMLIYAAEAMIEGDVLRKSAAEAECLSRDLEGKLKMATNACSDLETLLSANKLAIAA